MLEIKTQFGMESTFGEIAPEDPQDFSAFFLFTFFIDCMCCISHYSAIIAGRRRADAVGPDNELLIPKGVESYSRDRKKEDESRSRVRDMTPRDQKTQLFTRCGCRSCLYSIFCAGLIYLF